MKSLIVLAVVSLVLSVTAIALPGSDGFGEASDTGFQLKDIGNAFRVEDTER